MNTSHEQLKKNMIEQGAVFSDESTRHPSHFGSPAQEENTATNNVALFELSSNRLFEITGTDRTRWLHNFCTNDINKLQPGQWCEAFFPDIKSHALGHGLIFAEEETLWIEMPPILSEKILPHFARFMMLDDVELHDHSDHWGLLFLSGANSTQFLKTDKLPQLNQHQTINILGTECRIARVDRLGKLGFLLRTEITQVAELWQKIVGAGAQPAGSDTYNSLRIAAGYPLYGIDISENELSQEVDRSATAISFTKGCYLGQEPIARIDSLGHVNRKLCRLQFESKTCTPDSPTIYSAIDNSEIGKITSTAYSHLTQSQIALGYVKTKSLTSDAKMYVLIDNAQIPVRL